jgi:serine/threonine-protein kinase ATR
MTNNIYWVSDGPPCSYLGSYQVAKLSCVQANNSSLDFTKGDIASAWLTSARLARKGNAIHQSFNAVLHASQLGDDSATIEHARLLWLEGNHRKAIQALRGAIETNAFVAHNMNIQAGTSLTGAQNTEQQNFLKAKATLLLAKWLDKAGQTPSLSLRKQYQVAAKTHQNWEKGHYYLGRHYNKLLESEKAMVPELQSESYLTGETARLVIENYVRSLSHGTKYIYQTLPRLLTLWLDLGIQVNQPVDPRYGNSKEFIARITGLRKANLEQIHTRLQKYVAKMPAYMFYTALPQIVSRINHPNQEVFKWLQVIIHKVVSAHPQQALWSLLAVCTSTQQERRSRGGTILNLLMKSSKKSGVDSFSHDIKAMVRNGEKLTEQLLMACNAGDFHGNRTIWASLTKHLNFVQKTCLPSLLAVPVESVLTATLPTLTDNIRGHKAFSRDVVTINSFLDEVLVLSSLQKPRKLTARGSDGNKYGLMCKPKDDLRKDQRLMEFNSMINRSLKRDAECSRRQLYIKTYAVTPLNEECGIIEWVDGLKTLRDILLALYKTKGIAPQYNEIAMYCDKALEKPDETMSFFTEKVLGNFPPVFHKWFVQQFPEPSTWFAARLRYTRSCAVMSMVGTILGLGDRHGENILFEEGNGGTFHVDFNCLFDKGLTFAKPERVPFRLTHNMIDAMGMYGYEGPFRKSSELTLKLLRQHEETLMTILEAFVYDPTLDLLAKKPEKKKKDGSSVPQTAQGVLDTIQRKVKGLLAGESVPLSVEGQVDTLIDQATNPVFLAGMYIGWCSFL